MAPFLRVPVVRVGDWVLKSNMIEVAWVQEHLLRIPYFDVAIHTYGSLLSLSFIIPYYCFDYEITRTKIKEVDPVIAVSVAVACGMAGMAGARALGGVLDFFDGGWWDFLGAGGLSFQGGLILGLASEIAYLMYCKAPVLKVLDLMAPLLLLGHAIGKIGCFCSGDGCYGPPTDMPWAMSFPNGLIPTTEGVHPTPLYELFVSGCFFMFLWKRRLRVQKVGEQVVMMSICLGLERAIIERYRRHPVIMLGISSYQWIALITMLLGFALWGYILLRDRPSKREKTPHKRKKA